MYIRKLVSITAAALALAGSIKASAPVSLFDGKTLNGWIQVPANSWTVTNGVMASKGSGRGEIYTAGVYSHYRIIFSHRHNIAATGNHYGSALIFCDTPPPNTDALHGIQFGLPNGAHWDYRAGHNDNGGSLFHTVTKPGFGYTTWSRVEILVDASKGKARMAVAQPVGSKAVEVLDFTDPTAGKTGPVAFQMHNAGLFDEYKDITIEVNPSVDDLITTGTIIPTPDPVAAPVISPANGTFTTPQTVTITSATSGATIHYTVDGTFPTETTGTVYTGPFIVSKNTPVRAIASKSGMITSPVILSYIIISSGNTGTVFQAEAGTLGGGAIAEAVNTGFNGSGYVNFQTAGSTLTFSGLSGNGGGAKTVTVRYALGNTARTGVIIVNGVSKPITFPSTGSWTTWAEDVKANITLNNDGANSIQFASTGGDLANIDQITILPSGSVAHTYQAETAALAGGAAAETVNTGFNGTGYVNSGLDGATITFANVDGNAGGSKTLTIRYALGAAAPRTGKLTVNGVSTTITFQTTGSWTTWQALNVTINLNPGTSNTIQFASTGTDLGNIDEITVP